MGGHLAGSNLRTIDVCVRHLAFFTWIALYELAIIPNNVFKVHHCCRKAVLLIQHLLSEGELVQIKPRYFFFSFRERPRSLEKLSH